jgi:iron complex outermembrane receptor protein
MLHRWSLVTTLLGLSAAAFADSTGRDLADLSLEELGNIVVTSVSGRAEPLSSAAASIYVITSDDIRRAGVTTLPEALRLAPNLLVARVDTAQYAISARGFNSGIANKLLVLIDGRTVYVPLFSGVFWEMQDVLLEDVDRIEVISGPGATLWGANAVNGVVNIITRPAAETRGLLAAATAGNRETSGVLRYGHGVGQRAHFRVYAKAARLENTERADGVPARDDWERAQAGFRADVEAASGLFTLQGDVYRGRSEHRGAVPPLDFGRLEVSGMNLLARWTRRFDDGSDIRVQTYFDHTDRDDFVVFGPEADIFDLEIQHALPFGRHKLLWGGGYRRARDDVDDGLLFGFRPTSRELDWSNLFAQAEFALPRRLTLTLGLKLEENDYTGGEWLPTARLGWSASDTQFLWGGLSRAVRAPSRLDRDVLLPPPTGALIRGGPNFVSEVANVSELGYRARFGDAFTLSATAFHYDWDKLRSGQLPPAFIENRIEGKVYGGEAWATWQPSGRWRVSTGFLALEKDLVLESGSADPVGPSALGNDPEYQWLLRSSHDIADRHELDVLVRRVGALPDPAVPAYTAVDVNWSWRLPRFTLSLAVQNLLDDDHAESGNPTNRSEYPRGVYLRLRWLQ